MSSQLPSSRILVCSTPRTAISMKVIDYQMFNREGNRKRAKMGLSNLKETKRLCVGEVGSWIKGQR